MKPISPGRCWRWLRIAVAIVVSGGLLALFALPAPFNLKAERLAETQFLPAVMSAVSWGIVGSLGAFFLLALLTALFGRVYCSWLCPLGILQDVIGWCDRVIRHRARRNYRPQKNYKTLRLTVLTFLAVLWLSGLVLPLAVLEPYTVFGKIAGTLVRPLNAAINRLALHLPFELPVMTEGMAINTALAGGLLLALCAAVLWRGRIFCNTLCPAGALLSGLTTGSSWMLKIDPERCVHCNLCVKSCKTGCIDLEAGGIDFERCVMCLDCVAECPKAAVRLVSRRRQRKAELTSPPRADAPADPSRRRALAMIGTAGATGYLGAKVTRHFTRPAPGAVMPPGAGTLENFTSRCTGCGLCIVNCRGKVLRPAVDEYGLAGFLLPTLQFSGANPGKCEYECNNCTRLCPTGALFHLTLAQKKRCRLGLAHYEKELCIAYVDGEPCGACAEHCPTGALKMVPGPTPGAPIPQLVPELCIGCGNCQYACPVQPLQAIRIHGASPQTLAADPEKYHRKETPKEAPAAIPF